MENLIEAISGFILGLAVLTPILLKARSIMKEVGELLLELNESLEDGKLNADEIKSIVREAGDVLGIFKR